MRAQPVNNQGRVEPIPTKYTDIALRKERTRPQSTNTNWALCLIYVREWRDESIGVIKKALRTEIGSLTGGSAEYDGGRQEKELWPDVDAVRHINQYGTPTSPLMEIACTPDKADTLREFFNKQSAEICDNQHNPCIDPAINEINETGNRKLSKRMRNHFIRLLLA